MDYVKDDMRGKCEKMEWDDIGWGLHTKGTRQEDDELDVVN